MDERLRTIEAKVEILRQELDALALEHKDDLTSEQLLALSQELDRLLSTWLKLKTKEE